MGNKTKQLSCYLGLCKTIYDLDEGMINGLDHICIDDNSVSLNKDCLSLSEEEINKLCDKASILLEYAQNKVVLTNSTMEDKFNYAIITLVEKGDKDIEEELHGKTLGTLIMSSKK